MKIGSPIIGSEIFGTLEADGFFTRNTDGFTLSQGTEIFGYTSNTLAGCGQTPLITDNRETRVISTPKISNHGFFTKGQPGCTLSTKDQFG